MLVFAFDPLDLFPGAKVQFVQFDGSGLDDDVLAEKPFTGNLITVLSELDSFLKGRFTQKPVAISELREHAVFDFPPEAIRELLMNAILHRDYQSTSPVRFYQFSDRIEIQNPGGLYGDASPQNFPRREHLSEPDHRRGDACAGLREPLRTGSCPCETRVGRERECGANISI